MTLTTWAGNYTYRARTVHRPRTVDELQDVVAGARHVRALGTRHCFNDVADGPEALVVLDEIPPDVELDTDARTVTVGGGVRYGALAEHLHAAGWAVHNLASLPHISVAGAVATATHGSGDGSKNLAAAVAGLSVVGPDGSLREVRRGDDDFDGSVVALGALGVAARVTLDVEPTYDVAQEVLEGVPWDVVMQHYDELTASADSVSVFTDWQEPTIRQVWRKSRVTSSSGAGTDLFGGTPADSQRHMLPGIDPVNATQQGGVPGPWHERWPHFKLAFTPSNGDELQTEYLAPRRHAAGVFEAFRGLGPQIAPLLQVSEIRSVAADDLWLSSAYGQDVVGIHLTWVPRQSEVEALLPTIEAAIAPFDARPHWGKLFADVDRDLGRLYPRWDDFRALVARVDPEGTFRNDFLDRHVLG